MLRMPVALRTRLMATLRRWMAASLHRFSARVRLMPRNSRAKAISRLRRLWSRVMRRLLMIRTSTTRRMFRIMRPIRRRRFLIMINHRLQIRTISGRLVIGRGVLVGTTGFLESGVRRLTMGRFGRRLTGVSMADVMAFTMDIGGCISATMVASIMALDTLESATLVAIGTAITSTTTAP
jgi:hypothetical protein